MLKRLFHISTLAAVMAVSTMAHAAGIPRGISSISELLTLKIATRYAPMIASDTVSAALDRAVDESTFAGTIQRTANQVVSTAQTVANQTHARFYVWKTVSSRREVARLQRDYGFSREYLEAINPGVAFDRIRAETRVLIYRFDPDTPAESVGKANRGRIVNAMPMLNGPFWRVRFFNEAWGTPESVSHLVRGLTYVGETLPGGAKLAVGDLSYQSGGRMPPHRSHRSGRDADISYYSNPEASEDDFWNARYSPDFDAERQWALFRYWIEQDVVSYLFVDYRIQKELYWYALRSGEEREFLDDVFQYPNWRGGRSVIRHVAGHDDHFHVRFRCSSTDARCSR